jgi:opacity protein-like surface antigen
MNTRAVALAVALCLGPAWVGAQTVEIRVTTPSANVYKTPSTGSLVIGSVPRGTVLVVTRELGSWVKVPWPEAQEGFGYVHVSMGSIVRRNPAQDGNHPAAAAAPRPAPAEPVAATPAPTGQVWRTSQGEEVKLLNDQRSSQHSSYITPPTHIVGLGGRMGSSVAGYGASARAWSHDRVGVQLEVSRIVLTSAATPSRLTSMQFSPSVLYSLPDHVTDFVWMRPYLGAGAGLGQQTLSFTTSYVDASLSHKSLGLQTFGGSEMTFAAIPRFALSADLGYRWSQQPFAGFDLSGVSVSVSGHWYFK